MVNRFENESPTKRAAAIVLISFAFYFILSSILATILTTKVPKGTDINEYFGGKAWYTALNYGVFPVSFIIVCSLFKFSRKNFEVFEKRFFGAKYLPFILLFTASVIFGLGDLNTYFINFLQKFGYKPPKVYLPDLSVGNFTVCVIFICVLPAVCEELLFRKILPDAFEKNNDILITLLIGGLFALFHLSPAQTPYQFVFGCVFVMVVKITKSVYAPIIMHVLNNLTVLIFYYGNVDLGKAKIPVMIIGLVVFVALTVISVIKLTKNKKEKANKRELTAFILPYLVCFVGWIINLIF